MQAVKEKEMRVYFRVRQNPYSEQHENETLLVFADKDRKQLVSDLGSLYICYFKYAMRISDNKPSKEDREKLMFAAKVANYAKTSKKNKETNEYEVVMQSDTALTLLNLYAETMSKTADFVVAKEIYGEEINLEDLPTSGLIS